MHNSRWLPVPPKHVPLILALWNSGFYLYTYYVFSSPVSLHNVWHWRLECLLFGVCLLCEGLLLAADEGVCVLSHLESGVRSQVNIYEHIWLSIWSSKKRCHLDTSSETPKQEPTTHLHEYAPYNELYYHYSIYIYVCQIISIQHHLPYKWTIIPFNNQHSTTWHLSSMTKNQETGGAGSCKAPRELSVHIAKLLSDQHPSDLMAWNFLSPHHRDVPSTNQPKKNIHKISRNGMSIKI